MPCCQSVLDFYTFASGIPLYILTLHVFLMGAFTDLQGDIQKARDVRQLGNNYWFAEAIVLQNIGVSFVFLIYHIITSSTRTIQPIDANKCHSLTKAQPKHDPKMPPL